MKDDIVLEVNNLRLSFKTEEGIVKALLGISFKLKKGKTLALVGESGSGKSVTSLAVLGLSSSNLSTSSGEILYHGSDLLKQKEKDFLPMRGGKIAMIYQDPLTYLDPIVKIDKQLEEAILLVKKNRRNEGKRIINSLKRIQKNGNLKDFCSCCFNARKQACKLLDSLDTIPSSFELNKLQRLIKESLIPFRIEESETIENHFSHFKNAADQILKELKSSTQLQKLYEKYPDANNDFYLLP